MPKTKKRKPEKKRKPQGGLPSGQQVMFICLQCHVKEAIPKAIVRQMDAMDGGDPAVPPQFACEVCGGVMTPEYYKGVHGYEYRIEDVRSNGG